MEPVAGFGFDDLNTPSPLPSPVGLADYKPHANQPIQDPNTGEIHILTFPLAKWDALGVALGPGPSGPSGPSS